MQYIGQVFRHVLTNTSKVSYKNRPLFPAISVCSRTGIRPIELLVPLLLFRYQCITEKEEEKGEGKGERKKISPPLSSPPSVEEVLSDTLKERGEKICVTSF